MVASERLPEDGVRPRPLGPTRAAYAIRWLELGNSASLPAWASLIAVETAGG